MRFITNVFLAFLLLSISTLAPFNALAKNQKKQAQKQELLQKIFVEAVETENTSKLVDAKTLADALLNFQANIDQLSDEERQSIQEFTESYIDLLEVVNFSDAVLKDDLELSPEKIEKLAEVMRFLDQELARNLELTKKIIGEDIVLNNNPNPNVDPSPVALGNVINSRDIQNKEANDANTSAVTKPANVPALPEFEELRASTNNNEAANILAILEVVNQVNTTVQENINKPSNDTGDELTNEENREPVDADNSRSDNSDLDDSGVGSATPPLAPSPAPAPIPGAANPQEPADVASDNQEPIVDVEPLFNEGELNAEVVGQDFAESLFILLENLEKDDIAKEELVIFDLEEDNALQARALAEALIDKLFTASIDCDLELIGNIKFVFDDILDSSFLRGQAFNPEDEDALFAAIDELEADLNKAFLKCGINSEELAEDESEIDAREALELQAINAIDKLKPFQFDSVLGLDGTLQDIENQQVTELIDAIERDRANIALFSDEKVNQLSNAFDQINDLLNSNEVTETTIAEVAAIINDPASVENEVVEEPEGEEEADVVEEPEIVDEKPSCTQNIFVRKTFAAGLGQAPEPERFSLEFDEFVNDPSLLEGFSKEVLNKIDAIIKEKSIVETKNLIQALEALEDQVSVGSIDINESRAKLSFQNIVVNTTFFMNVNFCEDSEIKRLSQAKTLIEIEKIVKAFVDAGIETQINISGSAEDLSNYSIESATMKLFSDNFQQILVDRPLCSTDQKQSLFEILNKILNVLSGDEIIFILDDELSEKAKNFVVDLLAPVEIAAKVAQGSLIPGDFELSQSKNLREIRFLLNDLIPQVKAFIEEECTVDVAVLNGLIEPLVKDLDDAEKSIALSKNQCDSGDKATSNATSESVRTKLDKSLLQLVDLEQALNALLLNAEKQKVLDTYESIDQLIQALIEEGDEFVVDELIGLHSQATVGKIKFEINEGRDLNEAQINQLFVQGIKDRVEALIADIIDCNVDVEQLLSSSSAAFRGVLVHKSRDAAFQEFVIKSRTRASTSIPVLRSDNKIFGSGQIITINGVKTFATKKIVKKVTAERKFSDNDIVVGEATTTAIESTKVTPLDNGRCIVNKEFTSNISSNGKLFRFGTDLNGDINKIEALEAPPTAEPVQFEAQCQFDNQPSLAKAKSIASATRLRLVPPNTSLLSTQLSGLRAVTISSVKD